jgi:hypothetical protein
MCCTDVEPADVWNERHRRARKKRQCTECRGPIRTGERYLVVDCLWDGGWSHFYVCSLCEQLTAVLQADCDMTCYGQLYDELFEFDNHVAAWDAVDQVVAAHGRGLVYGVVLREADRREERMRRISA